MFVLSTPCLFISFTFLERVSKQGFNHFKYMSNVIVCFSLNKQASKVELECRYESSDMRESLSSACAVLAVQSVL